MKLEVEVRVEVPHLRENFYSVFLLLLDLVVEPVLDWSSTLKSSFFAVEALLNYSAHAVQMTLTESGNLVLLVRRLGLPTLFHVPSTFLIWSSFSLKGFPRNLHHTLRIARSATSVGNSGLHNPMGIGLLISMKNCICRSSYRRCRRNL